MSEGLVDTPPAHEHQWRVGELNLTAEGADVVSECPCGAVTYEPGGQGVRPDLPEIRD